MICIYHSRDLDGYASGAIVKRKYPDAKLIGFDYGQELPWDKIPLGEAVIMVDVSLPMEQMEKLAERTGWRLRWIDHHISAINEYKAYTEGKETFMQTVLQNGIAACEIAWEHLFPNQNMPHAILLLGMYDTFRKENKAMFDDFVMPFQFGMRQICNSPETFPSALLSPYDEKENPLYAEVIKSGKTILQYQALQNESKCRRSFEIEFDGYRAICLNDTGFNSQVFKSVYDESKHDIMIMFAFDGKTKLWIFSIYTEKDIDCSVMAKKRGGGGHAKACGFQSCDLDVIFKGQNKDNGCS